MSPWTCSSQSEPTSPRASRRPGAPHPDDPSRRVTPALVAEIRARIPRHVAVVGPGAEAVAAKLRSAGCRRSCTPTRRVEAQGPGRRRDRALTDRGPKMEVADSLLDLVGNTPMVRLDRVAGTFLPAVAKLEILNPVGASRTGPP